MTDRFLVHFSGLLRPALEDICSPVKQRLLPLVDHGRMHAILGSQLRHRAFALHGFQRHAALESSVMVPALLHVLISPR